MALTQKVKKKLDNTVVDKQHYYLLGLAEVSTVESRPRQDGRNMVMVLAPLRGKAEARREQGAGGRKGRERIDTTKAKPVTNSLADAMPAELKAQASAE